MNVCEAENEVENERFGGTDRIDAGGNKDDNEDESCREGGENAEESVR